VGFVMGSRLKIFLLRRVLLLLPILLGVLLVTFLLVRIGDQDPVGLLAGPTATADQIAEIRAELGLDRPVLEQFLIYVGKVAEGDLGNSWLNGRPVLQDLVSRIPVTLELLFWGVGLAILLGVPVGLLAAFRPNGPFDQASRIISLLGFSIPTYWLGLIMIFVFFFLMGWAPPPMGRISLLINAPPHVTGSYLDRLLACVRRGGFPLCGNSARSSGSLHHHRRGSTSRETDPRHRPRCSVLRLPALCPRVRTVEYSGQAGRSA
jgi:peptide/nickel transport system permease protein